MSWIVHLGGVQRDTPISGNILSSVAKREINLARDLGNIFLDRGIDTLNTEHITGSGTTLAGNEIK